MSGLLALRLATPMPAAAGEAVTGQEPRGGTHDATSRAAPAEGEVPSAPGGVLKLTLQDAIALARRSNPGLREAQETRDAARDRIAEARAQRLPQVSAGATYTYQGPVSTFTFQQPGQPPREIELNRATTRVLRATATLSTDLAGRIRAQQRIARAGAEAASGTARATENDLVFEVTSDYAAVLRAEELVRVRREAVSAAREQLRIADAQFRAGVVPQFDVLRASVQVENQRQEQIAAENTRRTAEARLVAVLNVDPTTRLELAPVVPPVAGGTTRGEKGKDYSPPASLEAQRTAEGRRGKQREKADRAAPQSDSSSLLCGPLRSSAPLAHPRRGEGFHPFPLPGNLAVNPFSTPQAMAQNGTQPTVPPTPAPEPLILGEGPPPGLEEALAEAYRQRPEIVTARENLRGAEEQVRFERRAQLPDVNIQGNYSYNPDVSGFSSQKSNYSVAANLNIPIFTGGLIRARTRAARDEADAARARLERVRQSVALDVRTALLNLREAEARRATAAANVNQAREALRIARVRYQAGVSTSVEVTDAEVALTQAQTNQVNADYDVVVAQAGLDRSVGRSASGVAR